MSDHVLVVGAGAIGAGIARELRRRRPEVRLTLADLVSAEGLATEVGGTAIRVDLAAPGAAEGLLDAVGPIDGLVNAAGVMEVRRFETLPWDRAASLLQIDLMAPLALMQAAVGTWVAAGRPGFVVNVTSMAGRVPLKGCAFYGAAKAGLSMASEIARAELAPRGIRVVTVYPGPVASALEKGARAQYAPGRIAGMAPTGDPAILAVRVLDALERGAPRVVYPRVYGLGYRGGVWDRVALALGPAPAT